MLEKMKEIIAEQLSVDADSITEASSFKDDLGADSLDLFELVMALEDEYSVEIPAEDLIQEGNIGLLLAMDTLDTFDSPAACQAHLLNCVNQAMEDAIHANEETKKSNEGIVSRVNHLNEAIHNLEEELEHKVSVDELSAYLEMPAAEIEDVLRMSGDQIEIEKN